MNADVGDGRDKTIYDSERRKHNFIEYRDKTLLTVLGLITVRRAYYYDRKHRQGYCPKDHALDIAGTSYSSGVRRMIGKVGAYRTFGLGHEDLYELAGIRVNAKEVERVSQSVGDQAEAFHQAEAKSALSGNIVPLKPIPRMYVCMDGTGVPVVKKETAGRKGKGQDGQAKTREVKLGCVFTQTGVDQKGWPIRDEGSTTYAGGHRTRRNVWPSDLLGGDEAWHGVGQRNRCDWRWRAMDMEYCGRTILWRHSDC